MCYYWTGNVRQLENVIERTATLIGDRNQILPADLPAEIQETRVHNFFSGIEIPDEGIDYRTVINNIESELIAKSLRRTKGNKKQAAKLLNLKRTTLVEKIKKMSLASN
jgi:transcriptional regulator with PAS, ATPase and Fis domain